MSHLVIQGDFNSRIFAVGPHAKSVTIVGMFIGGGHERNKGGAIVDSGGIDSLLTLKDILFSTNGVEGEQVQGGAVWKGQGTLKIDGCQFSDNFARADAGSGGKAEGGAVYVQGRLVVSNSSFVRNQADGANGAGKDKVAAGGDAIGGAIAYEAINGRSRTVDDRSINLVSIFGTIFDW